MAKNLTLTAHLVNALMQHPDPLIRDEETRFVVTAKLEALHELVKPHNPGLAMVFNHLAGRIGA